MLGIIIRQHANALRRAGSSTAAYLEQGGAARCYKDGRAAADQLGAYQRGPRWVLQHQSGWRTSERIRDGRCGQMAARNLIGSDSDSNPIL